MNNKKDHSFKYSFWNYVDAGTIPLSAVKEWKECGINLPMSPVYKPGVSKKEDIISLLDACEKNGIKMLISDVRTTFKKLIEVGEEKFRGLVEEAYEDFGRHPATYGFYIGDEPNFDEMKYFIQAQNIVNEIAKGLETFGNLLPYFGAYFEPGDKEEREKKYVNTINEYLTKTNTKLTGFDQYTQCNDIEYDQGTGINSYYYGLDRFRELCEAKGAEFFMSLLSVGHWQYRIPTQDDIRWQISTAVAHGARGIVWFYFYSFFNEPSYRMSPYYAFNRKTSMYDKIQYEQWFFQKRYGELINRIKLHSIYHINDNYHYGKKWLPDSYIEKIETKQQYPLIISYYKEYGGNGEYVSIVNVSQTRQNHIKSYFRNGDVKEAWLAPGEIIFYKVK